MSSSALASGVAGLSLVVAGCGTEQQEGGSAGPTGDAVARAGQLTLDAGSARVSYTTEHTTSDATWGYDAGEQGAALEGSVDFERHLVALGDDSTRLLIDGTTVYDTNDSLPDGRWRKFDLADDQSGAGALVLARPDPVRLLEVLVESSSVAEPFADVGTETVRGASTTRYLGAVEEEALARSLAPGVRYETLLDSDQVQDRLTSLGVWVDADGYVRRVQYDLSVFRSLLGGERTTIEIFDLGATVDIDVPSPENVVEENLGG